MRESGQTAVTYARKWASDRNIAITNLDFHVHVPAGAEPKDGPSGGVHLPHQAYKYVAKY